MVIIKYDFIVCLRMDSKNGLFICVSVYYPVDNFVGKPVDNRCGQRSLKYCLLDLFYYFLKGRALNAATNLYDIPLSISSDQLAYYITLFR